TSALQRRGHLLAHEVDGFQRPQPDLELDDAVFVVPPDQVDAVDFDVVDGDLEFERGCVGTAQLTHVAKRIVAEHADRSRQVHRRQRPTALRRVHHRRVKDDVVRQQAVERFQIVPLCNSTPFVACLAHADLPVGEFPANRAPQRCPAPARAALKSAALRFGLPMDTLDARRATVRTRIGNLRQAMARNGLAAVIVPSSDPHLSEYLPERWKGREWASGFTGSVGTLIVTHDHAGVWVDSRYWTQAEVQLSGTGVDLMKVAGAQSLAHIDWLAETLKRGDTVAVDGAVLGLAAGRTLETALSAKGIRLRTDLDVLAEVWTDRPSLPIPPIYEHAAPYATVTRAERLAAVREQMRKRGATHHFVSTLDDLAWLTNLRGSDVSYNPVFVGHLLIDARSAKLVIADG